MRPIGRPPTPGAPITCFSHCSGCLRPAECGSAGSCQSGRAALRMKDGKLVIVRPPAALLAARAETPWWARLTCQYCGAVGAMNQDLACTACGTDLQDLMQAEDMDETP